ncbi:MAG TPA: O-antigen ligase family protein [Bacteroidia bacterium]|jgi:O-antigen ligase
MNRKEFHITAHFYLALLIAFCLPLARLTPIFIVLMLLNWSAEGDLKAKMRAVLKNKLAIIFVLFFLMHLVGLIYTSNMDAGLFDVQVKLSLLIFPIILASRPFNSEKVNSIMVAFISGGVVSALIMLSRAIYTYYAFGENNFFYQAFSFLIHPSYLSMYYNLCIAWILVNLLKRENRFEISTFFSIAIIVFFSVINVLLSSKMGLLSMLLIYFGAIIWFIVSRKRYVIGISGLLLMLLISFVTIRYVPAIRDRVNAAVTALSASGDNQAEGESTAVRMLIWKAANQVISENLLLGAGTGDARDALVKEYEKRGMTGALEHKLNAHNEFYQVFVSLGIIGFLIFFLCLLFPLGNALKSGDAINILFLLIIILNFLPESMLETQAGVMFYAFFNALFCFKVNNQQLTE